MVLRARNITGNLAYWDTHRCRIIDAIGASVTKYTEHFVAPPTDDTTANLLGWITATDHNAITQPASLTGGVIEVPCGNTDNDEYYTQLGLATNEPFVIGGAAGIANGYPVYFGARVKALEHADEAYFVGLAEAGCAAANFLTDNSGVVADKDFIGFNTLTATPDAWNMTWKKSGQAVQTTAGVAVNAADWHIFEFFYDGSTTVTFFIDGVASTTTATTTAATFPGAEEMSPILAVKTGEAVLKRLQVDWLRVFQFS
jgi:hypothetical protein